MRSCNRRAWPSSHHLAVVAAASDRGRLIGARKAARRDLPMHARY